DPDRRGGRRRPGRGRAARKADHARGPHGRRSAQASAQGGRHDKRASHGGTVAQAWEPKPPKGFQASQAGRVGDEPPPHTVVPDGPGEAARALNRRLHPMNDELPGDLGPPKPLDTSERDGVPAFLDRRAADPRAKAYAEPTFVDLVTGGGR